MVCKPDGMASEEKPITVIGAIVANLTIAVAKFVAAGFSGSSSMVAEGFHSVVDTGNQALLLVGLKRSKRAPDDNHPFGYGKELYFWTMIVAVLLFGIGGGLSMYEGYHALLHPSKSEGSTFWAYVTLGIAFVAEGISWTIAMRAVLREGRDDEDMWTKLANNDNPSTFVVFIEDTAALGGIVVAFIGISLSALTGSTIPDALASFVIGVILCAAAVFLTLQTKHLMIGQSAHRAVVQRIEQLVREHQGVTGVARPLTMQMGPKEILVALDIAVEEERSSTEVARLIDTIEARIREEIPKVKKILVECQTDCGPGLSEPSAS